MRDVLRGMAEGYRNLHREPGLGMNDSGPLGGRHFDGAIGQREDDRRNWMGMRRVQLARPPDGADHPEFLIVEDQLVNAGRARISRRQIFAPAVDGETNATAITARTGAMYLIIRTSQNS